MRIKVVTSINVRSSPFTSPRTATQNAFPEPGDRDANLEKASPAIPSPAPRLLQRMDRLIASQRIPHGSRLSGWLHGSSVRRNDGKGPPVHARKTKTSHTSTYCFAAAEQGHQHQAPGIRSYPSTRGVIDPVHSPTYGPRQLTYGSDPRHAAYLERLRAELGSVPPKQSSKKRHVQNSKQSPAKNERFCFPHIKDLKLRQKMIGCVFFGTLLTIFLTTYLALAISESLHGATFHGVFIFFTLLLTILFCHYLIRLCMLAFEPRRIRFARKSKSPLNAKDDDDDAMKSGFAHPRRPIPVVLARDEELGLSHDGHHRRVVDEEDADNDDDAPLPPPPPAYGLWRSSVRADPNLIHWQAVVGPHPHHHHNDNDLQQEARAMIFAGTGLRPPPSYNSTSDDDRRCAAAGGEFDDDGRVEGVLEPERVAVAERRMGERERRRGRARGGWLG